MRINMDKPTTKELARFLTQVHITKNCWLWIGKTKKGEYGQLCFRGKNILAHRFSYELFVAPIKSGLCVLHRRECGNPSCVNPHHLYMGTHADNMRDRSKWGKTPGRGGESNHNAIITDSIVLEIRGIRKDYGYIYKKIAMMYGITESHVGHIIREESWKHLAHRPASKT